MNPVNVNNKELGELVLKAYRKRAEMHELMDHGLQEDELARAHEHVQVWRCLSPLEHTSPPCLHFILLTPSSPPRALRPALLAGMNMYIFMAGVGCVEK